MPRKSHRIGLRGRFFVEIDVRGGPRRSRRVPGVGFGRKTRENRAEKVRPDCLQVPSPVCSLSESLFLISILAYHNMLPYFQVPAPPGQPKCLKHRPFFASSSTSRVASSGCLKAVWLEIFGPAFPEISAETDPRDPPRSPGPAPHINFHRKNQPR